MGVTQCRENCTFLISGDADDSDFTSLEAVQQFLNQSPTDGLIEIYISTHMLNLTSRTVFSDHHSLAIVGNESTAIICNSTNAGIVFENLTTLELSNLKFISCGTRVPLGQRLRSYISAVTLLKCKRVVIRSVAVYKSNGVGLMILKHQGDNITAVSSIFEENNVTSDSERGGGGVYVGSFDMQGTDHLLIKFNKCIFRHNKAHTRHYRDIFTDTVGRDIEGYGRGGGLFLAFEQESISTNITTTITDCKFIGNIAFIGSGLSIKIGEVYQQTLDIFISNTSFESNGCSSDKRGVGLGGGLHLSFNSYNRSRISSNITMQNVNFTKNCAQHGGGTFIYSHKQDSDKASSLLFDECIFSNNYAFTGSAIDTSPNIFKRLSTGYTIIPTFKNCKFLGNHVYVNTKSYDNGIQRNAGIGTLYASLCDVNFEGFSLFKDNKGAAIYVVNGNAYFHNSSARFEGNTGVEGGALALIGVSSFVVGSNNTYEFLNNSALHRGGAVFVQLIGHHDFSLSRSCFIQYKDEKQGFGPLLASTWDVNITFSMNHAKRGQSIYATSIFPCQIINNASSHNQYSDYVRVDISTAFERWGISFDDERDIAKHIATDGGKLELHTSGMNESSDESTLMLFPGHYRYHGVKVFDDMNTSVAEPLRTTISKVNDRGSLKLDETSSSFVLEQVKLLGKPGSKALLSLQTVSSRQSYITLAVELHECPPGFSIRAEESCVCDASSYAGITGCNDTNSYLLAGLWAGMVQDESMPNVSVFVTSPCPLGYCYVPSNSAKTPLPQSRNDLKEFICGGSNRTGVVCGRCKENYSVYFHSADKQCREEHLCHIGWLFYVLSELIPVTFVFVTVLVLNISFASGQVNGFILYSQLLLSINIDGSGIVKLPKSIKGAVAAYRIIYGVFNLDFFQGEHTSFCLWKNTSTLDVIAFKYVTIGYALLLVISIIWFINKCGGRYLGKLYRITTIKSSVIHGISTFLIICYSQAVKTSLYLVNGHELQLKRNQSWSSFTLSKRVWLNAEMQYFGKEHLQYAIPAIFTLIVIGILLPLLLLMYPLLNKLLDLFKVGDSKPVSFVFQWIIPINSLKPLLDCFQGCFKDNMRFFAGLYFLYRWSALVAYTATSSFSMAYIVTQMCFGIILTLHALCQPYVKRAHNVIDTLLFADLGLIHFITFLHFVVFWNEEARHKYESLVPESAAFQMVLIYLPLVIFVLYVLAQLYKQITSSDCCSDRKSGRLYNDDGFGVGLRSFQTLLLLDPHHTRSKRDDLPHRLIADDTDSDGDCTEDSEYAAEKGCYRNADDIVTY